MATEDEKKGNQLRLAALTLRGTALGIWQMVGDSAVSLGPTIGDELLKVMEQEMGLEVAGETPNDILVEIGRLFVDEFGFAQSVTVTGNDKVFTMEVNGCVMAAMTGRLIDEGVDPFICPYRNVSIAALKRLGIKARTRLESHTGGGSVITFSLL